MSKEKQIEEMAKDLQETHDYEGCDSWHCDGCEYEKYNGNYLCESIMQAERLIAAGYRKQSENTVEVVRCKDCEHYGLNSPIIKNKHCLYFSGYDEIFTEPNDYCSFAKMKGGAE